MTATRPNSGDDLKAGIKATWAPRTPRQNLRVNRSTPRRTDAAINPKGDPAKYGVLKLHRMCSFFWSDVYIFGETVAFHIFNN